MFYESVRAAWEIGKVRVILSAVGFGERVTIEADGLVRLKAAFLSRGERQMLAELSQLAAQEYRAREEAIAKLATMPLLYRVGEVVRAIKHQYPSPEHVESMSKAEIEANHKLLIAQETLQADEADLRARALKAWGDDQLAESMFEWAAAMRRSADATRQHIETPDYQAWLKEP